MRNQTKIALRPATVEDAAFLLALRNDPDVRAQSWQTAVVDTDEHRAWLEKTLGNPDRRLYVIVAPTPIGQVRLDRHSASDAEISISLLADQRGKGYGKAAIRLGCQAARDEFAVSVVVAEVKPGNDASLAAFTTAGFTETAA